MREISADQVKKIIKQFNPHWKSGAIENEIRKFKKRRYFDLFFPLVTTKVKRAVVLMGPRRVGKTVLLWQTLQELLKKKNIKKKLLFLSLDAPLLSSFSLEELLDLYREIFSLKTLKGRVVIFDEIQYLKNWDIQLKVLVDNHPQKKFIASGSAAGQVVVAGSEIFPFFLEEAVQVVVVHQTNVDLTDRCCGHVRGVLGVHFGVVGLDIFQPLDRLFLAPDRAHGRDHRLERGVGGGPADAALPLRISEPRQVYRQVDWRQTFSVVDHGSGTAGNADPNAGGRGRPPGDHLQDVFWKGRQESGHSAKATWVLREEDVGWCISALFQQGCGKLGRTGVFDLNIDAGGIRETFD